MVGRGWMFFRIIHFDLVVLCPIIFFMIKTQCGKYFPRRAKTVDFHNK